VSDHDWHDQEQRAEQLAENRLGAGYLTVDEQIAGVPAREWTDEHLKRRVRPTHRCMIEVY